MLRSGSKCLLATTLLPGECYRLFSSVRRCRLAVSKPVLKALCFQCLKLQCDESLSNFGFNCNLRRYTLARMSAFADFQLPEMQRSPLEELCLQAGAYTRSLLSST